MVTYEFVLLWEFNINTERDQQELTVTVKAEHEFETVPQRGLEIWGGFCLFFTAQEWRSVLRKKHVKCGWIAAF